MSDLVNRAFKLQRRPVGAPTDQDLVLTEEPVPELEDGQALIQTKYLSLDPTNRIWMSGMRSYLPPQPLGEAMRGLGVGEVIASKSDDFQPGDIVSGVTGWQEYVLAGPGLNLLPFTTLPNPLPAPLSAFLGVLGHTGITAWCGLKNIGKIKQGDTVFVSAAAGATGSVAGQLAKQWGAGRVVGIAGGEQKCAHVVDTLGFDACVDHKAPDWTDQLDQATPQGIDVDFENVGGPIMDHVFTRLNMYARVILCGMVSQYNDSTDDASWSGQRNIGQMITSRVTMTSFIVLDHQDQFEQAITDLAGLWAEGKLHADETIVEGIEHARDAFNGLLSGANTGKLLIKVAA